MFVKKKLDSLVYVFLFLIGNSFGQENLAIDSLRQEILAYENNKVLDENYINAKIALSNTYLFKNNDSLLITAKEILTLSETLEYNKGKAMAYNNIALYYYVNGDFITSLIHFNKGLELSIIIEEYWLSTSIASDIASTNLVLGNHKRAFLGYLKAEDIAKKGLSSFNISEENETKIKKKLNKIHLNLGIIYSNQEDYALALDFYKKVLKSSKEFNDYNWQAKSNTYIAEAYSDMREFEIAHRYLNDAIELLKINKDYVYMVSTYNIKGDIYLQQKKYDQAINWLNKSLSLQEKTDYKALTIYTHIKLAETYLALNMIDKAESFALKSYSTSYETNNYPKNTKESAKILYNIYKIKGNPKKALTYLEIFKEKSDYIINLDNKKNVAITRAKLDYEKQKKELITKNNKILAKKQNFIYLGIFLFSILVLITFITYKSRRKQGLLNISLNEKTINLAKQEKELRNLNKTKDRIFSIIGHDLKAPIVALQSSVKLLKRNDIDISTFKGFLNKLDLDVDTMSFTLNNLLMWGFSQMNGFKAKPESITIASLAKNDINLLSEMAAQKNIKIENKLKGDIYAFVDKNQISIVIRNLLSNAIKFTPENGVITINAKEDKTNCTVMLSDTGVGINKETIKKLFDANSNTTSYGTNNEKGTGLGLSLCQEMIEKNNGKIWVESEIGKGTTFTFTLPRYLKIS